MPNSLEGVRHHASKFARLTWAALVVLATIGGVLGVYQFFMDRESAAEASPQAIVLRMVEAGSLTTDNASALLEMLEDTSSDQAAMTLASGTDRQKEALRLVAVRPTFEDGIEILEDEAKSAADWRLVAELSQNRDPRRAVDAARRAIALSPDDFDTLVLLVRSQLGAGDFADARRTQVSLTSIAQTPLETMKSAIVKGDLAVATQRPEDAKVATELLNDAIEAFEPLEQISLPDDIDDPLSGALSTASVALATRAQQRFITSEFAMIESDAQRAISLLEGIVGQLSGRSLRRARMRLAFYHDMRATAKHRLDQIDDHHEAHEKSIAQYRGMADAGDASARESLPRRLKNLALEYYDLEEPVLAKERIDEAITRFDDYASAYPDDETLKLERYDMLAFRDVIEGDFEGVRDNYISALETVRKKLLETGDPDDLTQISDILYRGISTLYRSKNRTQAELTFLHGPSVKTLSAFERRYGTSEQSTLQRFTIQLNLISTLIAAEADPAEIQTVIREFLDSLALEKNPAIEADKLNTYRLYALYSLTRTEPDNVTAVANEGLALAKSFDARGKLGTREQPYIAAFEALLKPAPE